jgi:hypothetical protein
MYVIPGRVDGIVLINAPTQQEYHRFTRDGKKHMHSLRGKICSLGRRTSATRQATQNAVSMCQINIAVLVSSCSKAYPSIHSLLTDPDAMHRSNQKTLGD